MPLPLIPLAIAAAGAGGTYMLMSDKEGSKKGVPLGVIIGAGGAVAGYFIPNKPLKYGVMAASTLVAATSGFSYFKDRQAEKKADKEDGNSVAAEQAKRLRSALTNDLDFFGYAPFPDSIKVVKIATEITCWDEVKKAYQRRYKESLPKDLEDVLSDSAYEQFNQQLTRGGKQNQCGKDDDTSNALQYMVTTAGTMIRTAPRLTGRWAGGLSESDTRILISQGVFSNEYATLPPGTFAGLKVKEVYDRDDNVWFSLLKISFDGKTYYFWMANQYLKAYPTAEAARKARTTWWPDKVERAVMSVQSKVQR